MHKGPFLDSVPLFSGYSLAFLVTAEWKWLWHCLFDPLDPVPLSHCTALNLMVSLSYFLKDLDLVHLRTGSLQVNLQVTPWILVARIGAKKLGSLLFPNNPLHASNVAWSCPGLRNTAATAAASVGRVGRCLQPLWSLCCISGIPQSMHSSLLVEKKYIPWECASFSSRHYNTLGSFAQLPMEQECCPEWFLAFGQHSNFLKKKFLKFKKCFM